MPEDKKVSKKSHPEKEEKKKKEKSPDGPLEVVQKAEEPAKE